MARTSKITTKDRLRIATLKIQGWSDEAVGKEFGVSRTTVQNQMTELEREVANSAPIVRQHMRNLEIILGEKMAMVLDQITEEKAAEANLAQLATALKLLNDMRRLEGDQATTSTEVKYTRVNLDEHRNPGPVKLVEVLEG